MDLENRLAMARGCEEKARHHRPSPWFWAFLYSMTAWPYFWGGDWLLGAFWAAFVTGCLIWSRHEARRLETLAKHLREGL